MLPPFFVTRFISETIFSGLGTTVMTNAATAWSKVSSSNVMFSASISKSSTWSSLWASFLRLACSSISLVTSMPVTLHWGEYGGQGDAGPTPTSITLSPAAMRDLRMPILILGEKKWPNTLS